MSYGPEDAQAGGKIVLLYGAKVPFVIRPVPRASGAAAPQYGNLGCYHLLIGEAYMAGDLGSDVWEAMERLHGEGESYLFFCPK